MRTVNKLAPSMPTANSTAATNFNWDHHMVFKTPSVRANACAERAPRPVALPAAKDAAARMVVSRSGSGTAFTDRVPQSISAFPPPVGTGRGDRATAQDRRLPARGGGARGGENLHEQHDRARHAADQSSPPR